MFVFMSFFYILLGELVDLVFSNIMPFEVSIFYYLFPLLYWRSAYQKGRESLSFLKLKSNFKKRIPALVAVFGFENFLILLVTGFFLLGVYLTQSWDFYDKIMTMMAKFQMDPLEFMFFPFVMDLITVGILGPLFEEIVFRGFLYQFLEKRVPKWHGFFSTVLFGLAHGALLPHHFIAGYFSYRVRKKEGDIYGVTLLHIANNVLVVVVGYFGLAYLEWAIVGLSVLFFFYYKVIQKKNLFSFESA